MAIAFASVANGGELLRPRITLGYVDKNGYIVKNGGREVIRRIMKESTADTLKSFMRGVVVQGTATKANSEAVSIAGKTGTAQIFDMKRNRYFRSKYMASFAGFFPYDKPLIAAIVVMEEPQPVHYGGLTAAPTFMRIAEKYALLNPDTFSSAEMMIAELSEQSYKAVEVPNLKGMLLSQAAREADQCGLKIKSGSEDGIVVWQFPSPDRLIFPGLQILVGVKELETSKILMADLKGSSLRGASAFCDFAGISYEVSGRGPVIRQSIEPGYAVNDKDKCKLVCKSI